MAARGRICPPTAWGARGRQFKSARPDHLNQTLTILLLSLSLRLWGIFWGDPSLIATRRDSRLATFAEAESNRDSAQNSTEFEKPISRYKIDECIGDRAPTKATSHHSLRTLIQMSLFGSCS